MSITRIGFISDTHLFHTQRYNEEILKAWGAGLDHCDVIIHCGDATSRGMLDEVKIFARWYASIGSEDTIKIFSPGNHDFLFEKDEQRARDILKKNGIVCLIEEQMTIGNSIRLYCSPWTPWFHDWAFNARAAEITEKWKNIPPCDILVTHGPPQGILDKNLEGEHCGCPLLLNRVLDVKPKIHAMGHIHEGAGVQNIGSIRFINASSLNRRYQLANYPIIVDYEN